VVQIVKFKNCSSYAGCMVVVMWASFQSHS